MCDPGTGEMENPLIQLVAAQKQGHAVGVFSICSANRFVLEAAMLSARSDPAALLIEATSNQVNQSGGYTGMTPQNFSDFVEATAHRMKFPYARVMLGGDHMGPNPWQHERATVAMANARELVRDCIRAGFRKIHLDTSMPCAGDPLDAHGALPMKLAVARAVDLAKVCEAAFAELPPHTIAPVYVIGTEVPPPGGAKEQLAHATPTKVHDAQQSLESTRQAFFAEGLESAWQRVIAVVVQPGVEFGELSVIPYHRNQETAALKELIERYPTLVFEAHSTDYQSRHALRHLVEDHFAILKVGPWLTLAFREAVFALEHIEQEWLSGRKSVTLSHLRKVLDEVMVAKPQHWQKHYHGDEREKAIARRFSYSDRIRYYWTEPEVDAALRVLLANLNEYRPPLTLLSQYLPAQCRAVQEGKIENAPVDLIHHKIHEVLEIYAAATRSGNDSLSLTG